MSHFSIYIKLLNLGKKYLSLKILQFAGFSAEALANRMIDINCEIIITSDGCYRANKLIALKHIADVALDICRKRYLP